MPSDNTLPTLPTGTILKDAKKAKWILGEVIGAGGFGTVYLARKNKGPTKHAKYVIKTEPVENASLEQEIEFYQNHATGHLRQYEKDNSLKIGIPAYFGWGKFNGSPQLKFLVIQRLGSSIQDILDQNRRKISVASICATGIQLIDALKYIHSRGFVHCDVKADNVLLSSKGINSTVYLADFGLIQSFQNKRGHAARHENEYRAKGTWEFCSRDAHKGCFSRKADLENLAYCLLDWLMAGLPWEFSEECEMFDLKEKFVSSLKSKIAIKRQSKAEKTLLQFLLTVTQMKFAERPNYENLQQLLRELLPKDWNRKKNYLETCLLSQKRRRAVPDYSVPAKKFK